MSPLLGVTGDGFSSPAEFKFPRTHHVVFLGPIHPERILHLCGQRTHIWLSLGLFNVLLVTPLKKEAERIVRWLKAEVVTHERWLVRDGTVIQTEFFRPLDQDDGYESGIVELAKMEFPAEVGEAVQEYCPLMASTLARSLPVPADFANDLRQLHDFVRNVLLIRLPKGSNPSGDLYRILGEMLIINAGLSRFAAQTFSGTTRIAETECHYWSHSLLGVGTANLALWRIQKFLRERVGEARLPARFKKFCLQRSSHDLTRGSWPEGDFLGKIELTADEQQSPLRPLLSYFSARDGFRSVKGLTISAPLAAVSACNSPQWSLMTLTHEISHVIIHAIITDLYPDLDNERTLDEAIDLINARQQGGTMLLEIRRIMLFAIHEMERVACKRQPDESPKLGADALRRLLVHWKPHIEETFVHVFDFLYFYGRDVDRYVRGIWTSWSTIPSLGNRLESYVVRTVCAVMSKHLRRSDAAELARQEVLNSFSAMAAAGFGGRYVQEAIKHLKQDWDQEIKDRVEARRELVKIVTHFLFSESIATKVLGEEHVRSRQDKQQEGYDFKLNEIELKPLSNPLHFLKVYTGKSPPSPSESAWVYHILAFCVDCHE
jgi:hypothetical protein